MKTYVPSSPFWRIFRVAILAVALEMLFPTQAPAQVSVAWVEPTRGVSVALDATDNVYTADFEYNPGGDIYLTKRNSAGAFLWTTRYDQTDSTRWEAAQWVATDSQGNAIVAGSSMSGYSNPVNAASILMKFNPAGQLLWRRMYESSFDGSYTRKCLVGEDDSIYVLGRAGGAGVTKVKKFSPAGTPLWSYIDSDGIGAPVNFKFAPDGHILITGRSVYGSINGYAKIDRDGKRVWSYPGVYSLTVGDSAGDAFGNTYLVHREYVATNAGTVIKKLDPSGTLVWQRVYGLSGLRVEVASDNQAVVSGFPNVGSGAAFIKVDGNGNLIWSNLDADGPLGLLAHAFMLLDSHDNAYLAAGIMSEMAVCKVNSDGASGWTQTIPYGYANSIALANTNDSVYVVGGTTARLNQEDTSTLPAAPSDLRYVLLTATSADLRWADNSSNETGFTAERCLGTLQFCGANPGAWSVRTTVAANVISFNDTTLVAGTTYNWRVKALNAVGSSAYSNTLEATTPSSVPAAPTELRAQAKRVKSRVEVLLNWIDNATNETGYIIERCAGSTCTDFRTIASLTADAIQYADGGVARSTTYRYRVLATGRSGNSPYSNIATVKTP